MRRVPELLARFMVRRPWWLLALAVAITAVLAPGIARLETETGLNTLVSPQSRVFQDNARYEEQFGSDEITVLLAGERADILSTANLAILSEFEHSLLQTESYRSVLSPATILEMAAAGDVQAGQFLQAPDGSINPALAPLLPDDNHALILITPAGNMDDDEALQAVEDVERFFSARPLDGVSVTVIGDARVMEAIARSIGNNMGLLLGLAIVVMIGILALTFQVRWRVLSLLLVGVGAVWTFGLMGYISLPLSMATMAVLPILIGLGIDYSIQLHNRYQEEVTRNPSAGESVAASLINMFPMVGIALLSTIIGFMTLYVYNVPMIRDFGVILTIGIAFSCLVALFLLLSILYLRDRKTSMRSLGQTAAASRRRSERALSWLVRGALKHPLPILIIAAALGIAGGVVDHWLPTNTDYERLMPQSISELRELRELRSILGSGGEVSFMVEADRVTDREVLRWLKAYQDEALARHPELVSASSPASLISQATGGDIPDNEQIEQILRNTPSLYTSQLVSGDGKMASLSFQIGYASLEQTHDMLNLLMQEARPPDGVRLAPIGTMALASSTVDALVSARLMINILCMGAVFVVLLLVYRRLVRALFVVLPVGLVIGVASLIMYIGGIALNPLTAVLGGIIVGINTEFMVLLTGRYEEEKRMGRPPREAMVIAASNLGRAIVATGLTTLGGFGVLVASNFVMISDFGMVTIIGVFLCLVSSIIVMPPLIVWWDERSAGKRRAGRPEDAVSQPSAGC